MLLPGAVDDYEVMGLLGRGGMGEVYVARTKSGNVVALKRVRKTLSLDPAISALLNREASMLGRVAHPNVVAGLGAGTNSEGQPYLVMSRSLGEPLHEAIAQHGAMSRVRIMTIADQLCDGLAAIHDAGVIHGDLKASNVLVDAADRVTIIDFGLARLETTNAEVTEEVSGTPTYMAPELMAGQPSSVASDIFAIAVLVYELLTGTAPLSRELPALAQWSMRMQTDVTPPSRRASARGITAEIDAVLVRALDRDPRRRFPSIRAFAQTLGHALAVWQPLDEPPTPAPLQTWEHQEPTLAKVVRKRPGSVPPSQMFGLAITAALDEASRLIGKHETTAAIAVLQAALARKPIEASQAATAWRLESVLGALYHSLGKSEHASRLARVAHQHAVLTGCPVALARCDALLQQLATAKRLAHGSRPNMRPPR